MNGTPTQPPTRVRYGVLAFVCVLSMVTYLDRAAFPNAEKQIQESLGMTSISSWFLALAAFNLAYALFEVPTGYLGDVFGPRLTLIRIVLWWSFFTMLSGLVGDLGGFVMIGFWTLVVIRFLFGMGEAGAYPNITRAVHNWLPLTERGWAQGLIWTSARVMGGLTPLIWLFLVGFLGMHWRAVFFLFGMLGVVWCVAFSLFFRNRPEEHPGVSPEERALIYEGREGEAEAAHANVPWGKLVRSPTLWLLCGMYFCINYGWYFNLNYLPSFMREQLGVDRNDPLGALYIGGPLLLGAVGCMTGGFLTDWLVRRLPRRRWARALPAIAGFLLASLCYLACLHFFANKQVVLFALFLALAGFFNDLTMSPAWAVCQDVGRRHAAIVAGTMNMIGNLGGFIVTFLTGFILTASMQSFAAERSIILEPGATLGQVLGEMRIDPPEWAKSRLDQKADLSDVLKARGELAESQAGGYYLNITLYAIAYLLGAIFWLTINADRPLLPEEPPGEPNEPEATPTM